MIRFLLVLVVLGGGVFYFQEDLSSSLIKGKAFFEEISTSMEEGELKKLQEGLKMEVEALQEKLETTTQDGGEKLEDIQQKLKEAQEAYEETKAALEKLSAAAQGIKEVFGE